MGTKLNLTSIKFLFNSNLIQSNQWKRIGLNWIQHFYKNAINIKRHMLRCKQNKICIKFILSKLNASKLKVLTKPIIKDYIEFLYINDQRQDMSSLLCSKFQILHWYKLG